MCLTNITSSRSVGGVFAPRNGKVMDSIPGRDITKLLKVVLAAPRLALVGWLYWCFTAVQHIVAHFGHNVSG